jgi:protocatechuate 3,4-dioxygenase beta subunit
LSTIHYNTSPTFAWFFFQPPGASLWLWSNRHSLSGITRNQSVKRLLSMIILSAIVGMNDPLLSAQDPESAEVKAAIDRAEHVLQTNGSNVSAILSDPDFLPVHGWPRFRELIKANASSSSLTIVTPEEPGSRLRVRMRVIEADNSASPGALVYFYHTDAEGDYGPNVARIPLAGSDNNYSRLFGYAVTDVEGAIEFHSIRPGGYPDAEFPDHIHLRIWRPDNRSFGGEIWFADDPRIGDEARDEAARFDEIVICPVTKDADGHLSIDATIRLD